MKIAFLAENFPSIGRPVFVFVEQLVIALVDLGIDVSVIAPQSLTHAIIRREKLLPTVAEESTKKGNRFKVYRPYSLSFGLKRNIFNRVSESINRLSLHKILNDIKPDILYGHFWHVANQFTPYALTKQLPLFVACGEGDNALEDLVESLSQKEFAELQKAVTGLISVSTENKRKCIKYQLVIEEDSIVLPNCVDDTIFHPQRNEELRNRLGISEKDFLLIFVGSFIPRKGPNRVVEAIKLINDPDIKVMFIGKEITSTAVIPEHSSIVFRGPVKHDELPLYLNASDAFVLPTLKEGCCNAIVEALACGVPVISSNRSFNDDILNCHNSITVDPEDVNEIAKAIMLLKKNTDKYKEIKEYVQSQSNNYSIINRAENIISFIRSKTL